MVAAAAAVGAISLLSILGFAGSKLTTKRTKEANDFLDRFYANIPLPQALGRFLDRRMRSETKLSKRVVAYIFRAHAHCHAESNAAVLTPETLAGKPDLTGALVIAPNWFFKSNMEKHYGIIMRRSPKKRGHWEVVFPVEHDCKTYILPQKDLTSWPIALAPFREQPQLARAERRRTRESAAASQPLRRSPRFAAKNQPSPTPEQVPTPPQSPRRPAAAPRPAPSVRPTPVPRRRSPRFAPADNPTPTPEPTPTPPSPCRCHEPTPQPTPEPTPAPAYIPPAMRNTSSAPSPATATQPRAPTGPAPKQYFDVAFFGLGTHGGPNELTAASQTVTNWVKSVLGVNLGSIEVLKRTRVREPQEGRKPDIVVVRMSRKAKCALFDAKKQLAGHIPISIGINREGEAQLQHCRKHRARRAAPTAATPVTATYAPAVDLIGQPPPPPPPRPAPAAAPRPSASGAGPSRLNPAAAPYTGPAATATRGQGGNPPQNPTSGPGEDSGSGSGAGPSHGDDGGGGGGDAQE